MKIKSLIYFCVLLGLSMTFSSCVKDSDISSENTIKPTSVVTSNLLLSSLDTSSFIDKTTQLEREIRIDTVYLEMTSSTFLMDQLSQANLTFKLKNSIEREFKIDVEFLNELDEVKFSLHIPVSSGTQKKPITVDTNVIIEIPELATFKEATKFIYKISLLPNEKQLGPESEGTLGLQSEATYYLDL